MICLLLPSETLPEHFSIQKKKKLPANSHRKSSVLYYDFISLLHKALTFVSLPCQSQSHSSFRTWMLKPNSGKCSVLGIWKPLLENTFSHVNQSAFVPLFCGLWNLWMSSWWEWIYITHSLRIYIKVFQSSCSFNLLASQPQILYLSLFIDPLPTVICT